MKIIQTTARSIVIPALLALLLSACSPDDLPAKQSTKESGAAIFKENCSYCHGPDRRGPAMDELHALTSDELRKALREHPTAGQIPQKLPAIDLQALIEFIEE